MNNTVLISNVLLVIFLAAVISLLPYISVLIVYLIGFDKKDVIEKLHQRLEERWLGFLGGDFLSTYDDDFKQERK